MNQGMAEQIVDGWHEDYSDNVMRVLAQAWLDAHHYRSVQQNAAQRKALIEAAIKDYLALKLEKK